ncbi:hypothetical protein CP8484711_0845, partial [Chlamydia psittaci 84-8471/1]
MTCQNEFFRT